MRDFAEILIIIMSTTILVLQVNYYLMGEVEKKAHLATLLRLYAGSRDVDSLAGSLDILLEGPIQRRLIPAVRWVLRLRIRRFSCMMMMKQSCQYWQGFPPTTTPGKI